MSDSLAALQQALVAEGTRCIRHAAVSPLPIPVPLPFPPLFASHVTREGALQPALDLDALPENTRQALVTGGLAGGRQGDVTEVPALSRL